jgi:cell wall-associated NlpC family hydrolase
VTTDLSSLGRPDVRPARSSGLSTRIAFQLVFVAALAVAALPAFAQQALTQIPSSSLAGDSADMPSAVTRPMLPEAMGLSDRALLLATDLNRLLANGNIATDTLAIANLADAELGPVEDDDGRVRTLLQKALALLGTPYRWGGTSPDRGFDCSGLVGYVFRNALGIELPRVSRDMARNGEVIEDRDAMAAGDLVFFGRRGRVNHVGIYLGEGRFVHAPRTGRAVSVSSLDSGYWSGKFMQARRVEGI